MEPVVVSIVGLGIFFLVLAMGMPIALSFVTAGFVGIILLRDLGTSLCVLGAIPYGWGSTHILTVLPLFVLMGQFTHHCGISKDLYDASYKFVGGMPGGLALTTEVACTGFAACTGSSLASAATMGTIAIPEMKRLNYDPRLTTGCVAAGGTLGILIPPSGILIIYGFMTETSIGKLFIAGILPGILVSLLFFGLIYFMCRRNPQLGPRAPSFSWRQRFGSLWNVWGAVTLFVVVIGGIYLGMFTPVEAGAMGAAGAFVISLIKRRLTARVLFTILRDAVQTTGMIFFVLIGSQIFSVFLALTGTPSMLADGIAGINIPPLGILIVILLVYIPLGMVMDSLPMILLTMPTFFPIAANLGFDPVWFGILVCVMCELANITPPVGLNLYIVKAIAVDIDFKQILLGVLPFAAMMMLAVAIFIAFPQIVMFLPNLML